MDTALMRQAFSLAEPFLFIPIGRTLTRLFVADLIYMEGAANYVKFHTLNGVLLSPFTMKSLIERLSAHQFCRINRSIMVNIYWVGTFNKDTVVMFTGQEFGFGENGKSELMKRIMVL